MTAPGDGIDVCRVSNGDTLFGEFWRFWDAAGTAMHNCRDVRHFRREPQ
jgi:hypothetical protein